MKKLLALVLALALLTVAAAFAENSEEPDMLARIQERGTLIIGTEGNWSPWTYHDEETDQLTGLDVEIGKLIAEGLGVEADFNEAAWDALLAGLGDENNEGRFDIICNGVGYTEERAEKFSFTDPYVYTHKVVVVRADNEDITSIEDLAGKTTANSASSTYAAIAEEYGATVTYVDTLGETVQMLEQGRVDATINAQVSIEDYMREHPEANIKIVQVLEGDPVAFPIRKSADSESLVAAINQILEEAREDGRLAEISEQFFGLDLTEAE